MITTGSKWFYGLGTFAYALAIAYGYATGGDLLGPFSGGYWGAVGDHLGYGLLLGTAVVAFVLGFVTQGVRDADPDAVAELVGADTPPAVTPATSSAWPAVAGFGVGVVALGLVVGAPLFALGAVILVAVLVEWTVQAWSDRATGDPAINRQVRNRLMHPVEIPLAGTLAVAVVVLAISRVFLAVSKAGAVWVAMAVSVVVLGLGALVASRPRLSSNAIAGLLTLAAVAVVAAGVVGVAVGEREFHHAGEEEHAEEERDGVDTGGAGGEEPTTTSPPTSTTGGG